MINGEIIVDNFAGGGGASTGIELATGKSVDIAINHDPEAIRMHKANHPSTKHYCESVWDVDPVEACNGKKVALAWFSPDCKHFSKAKGGKPKDKTIRGLAWVALRWAALVRPRVIMLENVEEFKTWGPLNRSHRPIKNKVGDTFEKFVNQLRALGYIVEFRELVAADYGAPTMRKRFFMIARCDGNAIEWPVPTHAPRDSEKVLQHLLEPYAGAYTQIDFNMPCPSIFDSSSNIKEEFGLRAVRPLAENTMKRIARGLQKFVIENKEPFIVPIGYGENKNQLPRLHDIKEPLPTIVSSGKHYLCTPYIAQIGQTGFCNDRSKSLETPLTTIVSKNEHCLIAPSLIQYHSETTRDGVRGQELQEPIMTVDGSNRYGLVSAFISKNYAGESRSIASDVKDPMHTITARNVMAEVQVKIEKDGIPKDGVKDFFENYYGKTVFGDRAKHPQESKAFLIKYYGEGTGQDIKTPLDTITTHDRFGLVTIQGVDYQIVDIGLRMLEPRELYGCQGFPEDYIIDKDSEGNAYPRTEQVKRCGNAVPPPFANALVRSNLSELCVLMRMPNMKIDDSQQQLRFA